MSSKKSEPSNQPLLGLKREELRVSPYPRRMEKLIRDRKEGY